MSKEKQYNAIGKLTIEEISPGLLQDIKDIAVDVAGIEEANTTSFDASKYGEGHVMHQVDDVQEAIDKLTDLVDNTATSSEDGLMSRFDKIKLDNIEDSANNYVHPFSHDASIIVETPTKRFVSDEEKNLWNSNSSAIKDLDSKIGDTTQLKTNNKTNLVNAINELKLNGTGGGTVAASTIFDVEDYEVFTATEQTNTFTIKDMSENKIVQIVKDGLELIKDVNYTLDKSTGVVTLGLTLEQGESIYYKKLFGADNAVIYDENEIIEGSTTFDADTLQGHGLDYFVTSETVNSKVDKSQIKNSLTETEQGNVLDATQGKILSDKINVLTNDRGYLDTNSIIKDFNLADKNGKYVLFGGSLNSPISSSGYAIALDVTIQTHDTLTQTAKVLWGTGAGNTYTRTCASGSWTSWQQIAINEYTPTSLSTNNLENGKWYLRSSENPTNDIYYVDCYSSPGDANYKYQVATYPFSNLKYTRNKVSGSWTDWQQIATTTKTPFSLTAGSGYSIISQNCYIMNDQTYINIAIKKTDETDFAIGNLYVAYSSILPSDIVPLSVFCYQTASLASAAPISIPALVTSKNIMISNQVSGVKSIVITGLLG